MDIPCFFAKVSSTSISTTTSDASPTGLDRRSMMKTGGKSGGYWTVYIESMKYVLSLRANAPHFLMKPFK